MSTMTSTETPSVVPPGEQCEKLVRPPIILGMSLGNPFFYKEENLTRLLQYADTHANQLKLFITEIIAEHNYKAIGSSHPKRIARRTANGLRNKCRSAIDNLPDLDTSKVSYVDWKTEVEKSEHYQKQLEHISDLFSSNEAFQDMVKDMTNTALSSLIYGKSLSPKKNTTTATDKEQDWGGEGGGVRTHFDIMEGVNYILKECAFFLAVPQIYKGFDKFLLVYHKPIPILDNLLSGVYDKCVRTHMDRVIVK